MRMHEEWKTVGISLGRCKVDHYPREAEAFPNSIPPVTREVVGILQTQTAHRNLTSLILNSMGEALGAMKICKRGVLGIHIEMPGIRSFECEDRACDSAVEE